jgi:hypothetical protein
MPDPFDRLRKIVGMLGSAHDGERLAAVNLATQELAKLGKTWPEIIAGESAASQPQPQQRQQPRSPLVPAGTCCRLHVQIRPGKDSVFTRSSSSPAQYLLLAFTITEPKQFAGVTFLDRFGRHGKNGETTNYFAKQGREHIKRMALSAGIKLKAPGDLNGIEILAIVGIRQRSFKNATGPAENYIKGVVVPGGAA